MTKSDLSLFAAAVGAGGGSSSETWLRQGACSPSSRWFENFENERE